MLVISTHNEGPENKYAVFWSNEASYIQRKQQVRFTFIVTIHVVRPGKDDHRVRNTHLLCLLFVDDSNVELAIHRLWG